MLKGTSNRAADPVRCYPSGIRRGPSVFRRSACSKKLLKIDPHCCVWGENYGDTTSSFSSNVLASATTICCRPILLVERVFFFLSGHADSETAEGAEPRMPVGGVAKVWDEPAVCRCLTGPARPLRRSPFGMLRAVRQKKGGPVLVRRGCSRRRSRACSTSFFLVSRSMPTADAEGFLRRC